MMNEGWWGWLSLACSCCVCTVQHVSSGCRVACVCLVFLRVDVSTLQYLTDTNLNPGIKHFALHSLWFPSRELIFRGHIHPPLQSIFDTGGCSLLTSRFKSRFRENESCHFVTQFSLLSFQSTADQSARTLKGDQLWGFDECHECVGNRFMMLLNVHRIPFDFLTIFKEWGILTYI